MQASILLISESESLSHSRSLLLKEWKVVVVAPAVAHSALTTKGYDLVIMCQTVGESAAAELFALVTARWPNTRWMVINRFGEQRSFKANQIVVDLPHPQWLPEAVARLLAREAS